MALYQKARAKYSGFPWDSQIHRWNAVQMGPPPDDVSLWQKAAQAQDLRFGASGHGVLLVKISPQR